MFSVKSPRDNRSITRTRSPIISLRFAFIRRIEAYTLLSFTFSWVNSYRRSPRAMRSAIVVISDGSEPSWFKTDRATKYAMIQPSTRATVASTLSRSSVFCSCRSAAWAELAVKASILFSTASMCDVNSSSRGSTSRAIKPTAASPAVNTRRAAPSYAACSF